MILSTVEFAEYADFGTRLLATIMDLIWLFVVVGLALYLLLDVKLMAVYDDINAWQDWKLILIKDVFPFLLIVFFWLHYAATPGKILADCKIVDATSGKPIGFMQAIIRYLAYIISILPLGLGFLWIIWDHRKQAWHDKIANTVVIMHDEADVPLAKLLVNYPKNKQI
jgi:uncharacterized RDD family membrane protein YckC